jgi:ER membrane protein complex subunit 10
VFELEHNVPSGSSPFSPRGKVEVVISSSSAKPKVTFVDTPLLSAADIAHLESLLRAGKHYSVRARSDPANAASPFVLSSIPMCMLAGTRMREDLTLHLSDNGKLLAIEYLTPYVSEATCLEFQKVLFWRKRSYIGGRAYGCGGS